MLYTGTIKQKTYISRETTSPTVKPESKWRPEMKRSAQVILSKYLKKGEDTVDIEILLK